MRTRGSRIRGPAIALACAAALSLGACGDDDDSSAESPPLAPGALPDLTGSDPCEVFSSEEVTELIDVPVGDGIGAAADEAGIRTATCIWSTDDFGGDPRVNVTGMTLGLGDAETYRSISVAPKKAREKLKLGEKSFFAPAKKMGAFAAVTSGEGTITVTIPNGEPQGTARKAAVETLEAAFAKLSG